MIEMRIRLIFYTLIYLKPSQIFWQIVYRLKSKRFLRFSPTFSIVNETIVFGSTFDNSQMYSQNNNFRIGNLFTKKYLGNNCFVLLNLKKKFELDIDWNEKEFGKLWTYNLEYLDYIFQENISKEEIIKLIKSFYKYSLENKRVLEPYPVSIRVINIIKFSSISKTEDAEILNYVYQECSFLNKNLEYHILANHLLENVFALALGAAYFKEKNWLEKAKNILTKELNEQILSDGAHFELSPMYHQIVFFRLLELIDWYGNYNKHDQEFLLLLINKAKIMRSWLENISFKNGEIPLFNDASNGIAYTTPELLSYCNSLNINNENIDLKCSGYRSYAGREFEIKVDFAKIGATYQPGHAHADALSFQMFYKNKPLFVEAGTSTYQIGGQRSYERSTEAHNTVVVNQKNQSQVWSGFRVGKRAKTTIIIDEQKRLQAYHDGYVKHAGNVSRYFLFKEKEISIIDSFEKSAGGTFYLHLAKDIEVTSVKDGTVILNNGIEIIFTNYNTVEIKKSRYAVEFNQYIDSSKLVVNFTKQLNTVIKL